MSDWKSIETAPKDGTDVLLFYPTLKHTVQFGHWWDTETYEFGKLIHSTKEWSPMIGLLAPLAGPTPQPSHWMALPQPPMSESA